MKGVSIVKAVIFSQQKKKAYLVNFKRGGKKEVGERLFIAATADRLQLITGLVLWMFHEKFIAEILIKPLL